MIIVLYETPNLEIVLHFLSHLFYSDIRALNLAGSAISTFIVVIGKPVGHNKSVAQKVVFDTRPICPPLLLHNQSQKKFGQISTIFFC